MAIYFCPLKFLIVGGIAWCVWSLNCVLKKAMPFIFLFDPSISVFFLEDQKEEDDPVRSSRLRSANPNRKSRKTVSPKVKVTAFRGYVPRFLTEPWSKKGEHYDSDEETGGMYNRLLSTDPEELTGGSDIETVEVNLPQNALSTSVSREVDVAEESALDMLEVELSANALTNISLEQVEAVDEVAVEEDEFEEDFSGIELSSDAVLELDSNDEAKAKEDILVVDSLGILTNSDKMSEVVDEAEAEHDRADVDLLEFSPNDAVMDELDLMDEAWAIRERFDVDLPGNASRSGAYGIVGEVGEPLAEEDTFEMDSVNSASDSETYMSTKSSEETSEVQNEQRQYPTVPSTSIEDKAINGTHETLKPESMPLVRVQGQDKLVFDVDEGSIVGIHEEDHPMEDYHWQEQNTITFDEQKQLTARFPEDLSTVQFPEQNHDIVGSPEHDVGFSEQNQVAIGSYKQDQSIVRSHEEEQGDDIIGSHRQDKSIVGQPEQIQSVVVYSKPDIVGPCRQDESIVLVPEQIQSIVGYNKPDQSIVSVPENTQSLVGYSKAEQSIIGLRKQQQSMVHIPEEKQSIVGFHKQDLSSKESQTEKLDIPRSDTFMEGVEAKDGDYTPEKIDEDTLHAKSDVNLLAKHEEHLAMIEEQESTEEEQFIVSEEGLDEDMLHAKSDEKHEEHLAMIEEQESMEEEQFIVTEEGISVVDMGKSANKFQHQLSEEEERVDDEVRITEDEEHYEVEGTSVSAEQDIQSPQDDMDPQVLQRMLQGLAEKNYSLGSKLFVYPEVLKADSTIALYFNRDLSALANEPDVLIKGAFNGWKWMGFTEKLHKSELGGDWWSCKLYIPKQAYRLDFVFFNGRTMYENNGKKDFVMQIESSMDERLFADFLVEEKKRELERLAIEEAERKNQTEEQKLIKEERIADEADRAQAKAEVQTKKNKLQNISDLAKASVDNLWYIEPMATRQEATVRLYYNRKSGPLVRSTEIWMHGGYNNWIDGLSFSERLHRDDEDSDWWHADVVLPERTYMLDWVFADGPPGKARNYDNNGRKDFHAILPNNMTGEEYWVEEEQRIYTRLKQERREREEAIRIKADRRAKMKAEMKEKTMRMFLVSQKHIVYTEPLEINSGATVDVLYNPSNTVLNGKPEVWFRCSFNRWMHPGGVLPAQKMDAYIMDFVFSESEEGGIFDNRNGLDYHIPIFGSVAKEPPMHIVHIAVEMAPIAKVGGLGDVKNLHIHTSFSWEGSEVKVWRGLVEDLCVYFLEPQNGMFNVGCVYGRNDDRRFGFFCHSALEFLLQSGSSPVSNTYSREVSGHGAIAPHLGKFYGILNGIDQDIWDPYNDSFIPVHYTPDNVIEGKRAAKKALQQKLGLQQTDVPIVGIITRLTAQKGIHLIKHAIGRALERNGQVVLLGSAPDPRIQGDFANLANTLQGENHGRVRLCLTYDEPLSHLIYAGSDFILVPSIFEPCGLTQLVAMRYGAIPIVRKTGGLYDTVFDVDNDKERARAVGLEPNGFSFDGADNNGVDYALNRQAQSHGA
ncbi:hypothetical protein HU200_005113 [Digitaria exilis]|uniref:starch synthase n=1 Tax=Digitaria exilis TaxID=1010633 RepID=A0A835FTL9_9POAL|nr:hypothetical protein HU200_005113 [Digitaria exilis]